MKKIVAFHLYNDYSGSPKVLTMVLEGLLKNNYHADLISSGKGGALDQLSIFSNFRRFGYKYKFSENTFIEIIRFLYVQLIIFIYAFRYLFKKDVVFYINTLLPAGAAIAGYIMRKRIIYHYHENAGAKGGIYKVLAILMQYLADDIICVSNYQANDLKRQNKITVISNVLNIDFYNRLKSIQTSDNYHKKNVLMLSSLKTYKGINEFVKLAKELSDYNFTLVINDEKDNIDSFLKLNSISIPENINVFARQSDVVPFYNEASLVLNLSDKSKVIETFGLTVLEAFTAGIPVIVPTVGGIAELVEDDVNGYKIDVANLDKISLKIKDILSDHVLYSRLKKNAIEKSSLFKYSVMIENIEKIINK